MREATDCTPENKTRPIETQVTSSLDESKQQHSINYIILKIRCTKKQKSILNKVNFMEI